LSPQGGAPRLQRKTRRPRRLLVPHPRPTAPRCGGVQGAGSAPRGTVRARAGPRTRCARRNYLGTKTTRFPVRLASSRLGRKLVTQGTDRAGLLFFNGDLYGPGQPGARNTGMFRGPGQRRHRGAPRSSRRRLRPACHAPLGYPRAKRRIARTGLRGGHPRTGKARNFMAAPFGGVKENSNEGRTGETLLHENFRTGPDARSGAQ